MLIFLLLVGGLGGCAVIGPTAGGIDRIGAGCRSGGGVGVDCPLMPGRLRFRNPVAGDRSFLYYAEKYHGGSREADDRLVELRNNHKAGKPLKFKVKTFADYFEQWLDDLDDGKRRECTIEK